MQGNILKCFESYLTSTKQDIEMNTVKTKPLGITCGGLLGLMNFL